MQAVFLLLVKLKLEHVGHLLLRKVGRLNAHRGCAVARRCRKHATVNVAALVGYEHAHLGSAGHKHVERLVAVVYHESRT